MSDNASDDHKTDKDKYRNSVFLPTTEFPMRGGLPQKEPEILAKWQEMDLYAKMREAGQGKERWVLHDGPPYANGNIHMGHAMNKILKDVVVKSYSMMGYDAPYVPGWDCHGLPIEWKIEEKYRDAGKDKDAVAPLDFRAECRNFAKEWVDIQSDQFERLGVTGDWKAKEDAAGKPVGGPYLTMTDRAEGKIVREIHKFSQNGGLYRGARPIMWSVVEKTALAEAEIEYKEHKSVTIWVRFAVKNSPVKALEGADMVIWTTTPWTIPSNRAMAYGKDIEYGVYEVSSVSEGARSEVGDKIALATALADEVAQAANIELTLIETFKGEMLGAFGETKCQHPLAAQDEGYSVFDVPLLEGDFVTDDAGTGFVHIAPGHGEDDFKLVQGHNYIVAQGDGSIVSIEVTDNVADDGKFRDHVPLFAGLEVYTQQGKLGDGNFAILKELDGAGKLLAKGSLRHEYPHSWRSKAPLIFRTTPQWFISMETNDLRQKAMKAIEDTRWVPGRGEARIRSMVENRPDWCISRQRAWGVPIALFVHKETGETLNDPDVLERIGSIFEEEGADSWWARPASEFLGSDYNAEDYEQIFDIVDVWFESGSTHAFVCEDRDDLRRPDDKRTANLYLEGSDQHRGWFHSSLLESCGTRGRAPYDAVLTHGFVLDEKGYKMSKSQGNVVDPLKLMDQYGADILRLWTMTSDYGEDMRIGQDMLKGSGDLYRRIRNTLRFLLGALEGFSAAEKTDLDAPEALPELEQLMLHKLYEMDKKVRAHIEDFEFSKLAKALHEFCNEDLSAFYFDIRKDRLYCDAPDSAERRACRSVMAVIFDHLTAWLAPILVFTAEEAWSHKPQGIFEDSASVHLREYPAAPEVWQNAGLAGKWFALRDLRKSVLEAIEPLRTSKELGSSLEALPVITLDQDMMKAVNEADLPALFITSQVQVAAGDETSVTIQRADGGKCQRCWKVLPEVKDELCTRCSNVVAQEKAA